MKKLTLFFLVIALGRIARSQEYDITKFGVGADSLKLHTETIQKVIDKAHENGGGTIVIPKGVYLTGALFLKPKTKLVLREGAVLKGSDDIADYPLIPSRMEGQNLLYYAALINAYYVDSFSILGPGTIDGNGARFWKEFWSHRDSMNKAGKPWTNLEVRRPRLIFIWGCNNVTVKQAKLRNSAFWTTHLYQCNDVLIEGCDIRSPFAPVPAPSTDGIDLDVCRRVTIRNCYISVNDDAIAIKGGKGTDAHKQHQNGPVEDVLIENCTFGESHGTLTMGSECLHARNIVMRNCKVENKTSILRLKMRPDTYQIYENITIEGITGNCGTLITLAPWTQFFNLKDSSEKPFGTVRNITFSNINVKCNRLGDIKGNAADKISDIIFRNITAIAATPTLKTNNYPNIKTENVTVNGTSFVIQQ
ncbi:MAG: glycosyl hydrolase family 28 protein [Chitinophagaceae bacterium]